MSPDDAGTPIERALAAVPGETLVVGFSGGLDSTVLLHAAAQLAQRDQRFVRALHVDHGLHPQSREWAAHCVATGRGLGVLVEVVQVRVEAAGEGIEAAARRARYRAFEASLQPGETLLLGHHREDQAETVLLRLLRGSGSHAVAAMRGYRSLGAARLSRPLLGFPRVLLADYASRHQLRWIDDPANRSLEHDRNFLRHEILPRLQERWPDASARLARSARLLAEDADRLAEIDARRLAMLQGTDPACLDAGRLRTWPPAAQRALLRHWIAGLGLPVPGASALDAFPGWVAGARADAQPVLRWPGAELRRYRDRIHAMAPLAPLREDWSADFDGSGELMLADGFGSLRVEPRQCFDPPLTVRPRHGGERLRLPGRSHSHALKDLLQQRGVPPWQRRRTPLLFAADGELLAAGDLVLSARWEEMQQARDFRLRWETGRD